MGTADLTPYETLWQAMTSLRPEQLNVLILRFAKGLSSEEVGRVLGKSTGAIRIQQLRALRHLRTSLTTESATPLSGLHRVAAAR